MDKHKKTILQLILSVVIVLFLFVIAVPTYRFVKETKEFRKRVENGEFNDYHNQPNNEFGAPIVYYKSDLERIVGVSLREKDTELAGVSCTKYWNNRNKPTIYDDLRFYIFSREKNAIEALNSLKNNTEHWDSITYVGDNYIRGWEAGTIDAEIEMYYYRNGNLIVEACVTSVDESPRSIDDDSPAVLGGGDEAQRLISLITDNF